MFSPVLWRSMLHINVLAALIGPRVSVQRDHQASAAKKAAATNKKATAAKKAGEIIIICVLYMLPRRTLTVD